MCPIYKIKAKVRINGDIFSGKEAIDMFNETGCDGIIGLLHPAVVKWEYYFGTKGWWMWLVGGIVCCVSALFVAEIFWSALLGVTGASLLWGIGELFEQVKRVEKGWFPMNPKRKNAYKK